MKRNERKEKGIAGAILAFVLIIVIAVGGAVAGWYAHAQNWFGLALKEPSAADGVSAGGGLLVEPDEENGIRIAASKLTEEVAEAEGIPLNASDVPNLDQIYILTATVTPTSATGNVKWSMAFFDSSAEWAVGKSPEDYVALRPIAVQSDATSAKAIVECKGAFGEQIKITCAADEVYGTCTADYAQRIIGMNVWFDIVSQEAGGAAIAQVDLIAGEDIYIPISSDGAQNYTTGSINTRAYELKAEPILSDVYTVAESNAQCRVSFLTAPASEGDAHRYFNNANKIDELLEDIEQQERNDYLTTEDLLSTNEVVAASESGCVAIRRTLDFQSVPNALAPADTFDESIRATVTGHWQGKIGAYYTFDQYMMNDIDAQAEYYGFYVNGGMMEAELIGKESYSSMLTTYHEHIVAGLNTLLRVIFTSEEASAAINDLDKDVVLWRVAASVTGTYGSYTRGDSFIMYCTGETEDAIEIPISNDDPGEIVF